GAAGGGWLLAGGGVGAKLAVGCLVAVSVGAGCVALTVSPIVPTHARTHHRHVLFTAGSHPAGASEALSPPPVGTQLASGAPSSPGAAAPRTESAQDRSSSTLTPPARASREFGLEQPARHDTAGV